MKNKIIALTLAATLALSSAPAFAADCTTVNYDDINNALNKFISNYAKTNTQFKITVNGKAVDLNSTELKTLLNNKTNVVKPEVKKPAITKTAPVEAPKPVETPKAPEAAKPAPAPAPAKPAPAPAPVKPAPAPAPAPTTNNNTVSSSNQNYEQRVVELVNVERQKA